MNLAFDSALLTPDDLLDTYHTLTGWSRAMTRVGARVHVVQRFTADAQHTRDGVTYTFVADGMRGVPRPWDRADRAVAALVRARPDLVHVNGLMFPAVVRGLRAALGRQTPIVLQDHSGALPRRLPWPAGRLAGDRWRRAFHALTACSFTAGELAARWYDAGLPRSVPILELPESSTDLTPIDRRTAEVQTGMRATPAILWVGRLDANKDPTTALDIFERALPGLPEARVWMVFRNGPLEALVRRRVGASTVLRDRVALVGEVSRDRISAYFSAADLFVSASHHEGSGYALIEALACGTRPCVTDIPAFRALAGADAACWSPGDTAGGARALLARAHVLSDADREARRRHFDATLQWDVVARQTLAAYRTLVEAAS